jgi:hypothetical protein
VTAYKRSRWHPAAAGNTVVRLLWRPGRGPVAPRTTRAPPERIDDFLHARERRVGSMTCDAGQGKPLSWALSDRQYPLLPVILRWDVAPSPV